MFYYFVTLRDFESQNRVWPTPGMICWDQDWVPAPRGQQKGGHWVARSVDFLGKPGLVLDHFWLVNWGSKYGQCLVSSYIYLYSLLARLYDSLLIHQVRIITLVSFRIVATTGTCLILRGTRSAALGDDLHGGHVGALVFFFIWISGDVWCWCPWMSTMSIIFSISHQS